MLRASLVPALLLSLAAAAQDSKQKSESEVPVISGDLGSCSADFTVTSTRMKPIYKAKLAVEIRYGFGGFRKTELEIYTNVDGKARVEGLPEKSKRPLSFTATYEGRATAVVVDPAQKCHGTYSAVLSDKVVTAAE
jgi:hypothetical protein